MKRLHVNIKVKDLSGSVDFYRQLFMAEPAVVKSDYAKWMLEDLKVNFALSLSDQQVEWEIFRTYGTSETFKEDSAVCCGPECCPFEIEKAYEN